MNIVWFIFIFMATAMLTLSSKLQAQIDPVEFSLQQSYHATLRWDNIEAAPYWVEGKRPQYQHSLQMHTIHFLKNSYVIVRLPARRYLRLYSPHHILQTQDWHISISNGSGIWIQTRLQNTNDPASLIIPQHHTHERLVRLRFSGQHSANKAETALFLSRLEHLGTIAPYRNSIPLNSSKHTVRREHQSGGTHYWQLVPTAQTSIVLTGPKRIKLQHRSYSLNNKHGNDFQHQHTYHLNLTLNGKPWKHLTVNTTVETHEVLYVDNAAQTMSRLNQHFIEIPDGTHTLAINSSQSVLARLTAQSADYLFPQLNAPNITANDVRNQLQAQPAVPLTWPLNATQVSGFASARIDQLEYLTAALVKDNAHRNSPLSAAMIMQTVANTSNDVPKTSNTAQQLLGAYTFFRHLYPEKLSFRTSLPDTSPMPATPRFQAFHTPRLLAVDNRNQGIIISAQHTSSAAHQSNNAYFIPLPDNEKHAHQYPVPPRDIVSTLRLIVHQAALATSTSLFLQYDDAAIMSFEVEPQRTLPTNHYAPDLNQAALAVLSLPMDPGTNTTTTVNRAATRVWAKTIAKNIAPAAILELPLPPHVNNIKLWRAPGTPVQAALQYRSSKSQRLNEIDYLRTFHDANGKDGVTTEQLKQLLGITPAKNIPAILINDWLPIARQLRNQKKIFSTPINPTWKEPTGTSPLSSVEWQKHRRLAVQAEQHQQWLTALEQWSIVAQGTSGHAQRESHVARISALQQLGEHYLSNQLLKGWFLHAKDQQLRHTAKRLLAIEYIRAGNTATLMGLLASALLFEPIAENIRPYINLLMDRNQYQHALLLALALPPTQRPNEALMLAAYKLKWWHVFDATQRNLAPAQQQLWLGYRAVTQGDFATAQIHWQQAGEKGQHLIQFLQQRKRIISDLSSIDKMNRSNAMLHKKSQQHWQSHHPGPYSWQSSPEIVTDHSGIKYIHAIEQDTLAPAFITNQKRPVKINVYGPITLRFRARVLHPAGNTTPIDDWLIVRQGQQSTVSPINANRPTQGLALVSSSTSIPGAKLEMQYTLGVGYHELTVAAAQHELLLQVSAYRPQLPLPFSVPLLPQDITTTIRHQRNATNHKLSCQQLTTNHSMYRCQYALNTGLAVNNKEKTNKETLGKTYNPFIFPGKNSVKTKQPKPHDRPQAGTVIINSLTSATLPTAIIKLNDNEARSLMTNLLWHTEKNTFPEKNWLPIAGQLFQQHTKVPGLKQIYARLNKGLSWKLLESVSHSAGIYSTKHQGWNPASPSLRARKALLGITSPNTYIISGKTQYGLTMTNLKATTIRVQLELLELPFAIPVDTKIRYRLNQKIAQEIVIGNNNPTVELSLKIPVGEHTLRFSLVNPVVNQFLAIKLEEQFDTNRTILTHSAKRTYHVATHTEPVQIDIQGPVRLRIDEWSTPHIYSRYKTLEPGSHHITLTPGSGTEHTYYRIYQREKNHRGAKNYAYSAKSRPRTPLAITPKPAPLLKITTTRPAHGPFMLTDNLPLRSQEDGSWSWSADLVSRRQINEDRSDIDNAEQFLQLNATHRYFTGYQHTYTKQRLIARIRNNGGPSLGLQGGVHHQPRWQAWRATLRGNIYLQNPEKTIDDAPSHTEWSATIRGSLSQYRSINPKSFHIPKATIFQRKLSLTSFNRYQPDAVDQDIFSRYKYNHQRGIILEDKYVYKPWLDSEWNVSGAIASNKQLNPFKPDYFNTQLTWKQLLGNWQVNAEYGYRYYFDDSQRATAQSRNRLGIAIDTTRWHSFQRRWQFYVQYRYDVEPSDSALMLTVAWHGGNGRALRDFSPGEIDFRLLQKRRSTALPNNDINGHYTNE
ncbi:MAG: hypothetical protein GXP08_16745 [Gammaproteobacteria bacterium]|nr:hypothetical protein [Gammaproteobacteria bacterium]